MERLCIDCKWVEMGAGGAELSKCNAPQNYTNTSLITGKPCRDLTFCDILRKNRHSCGPEGAWFVERKPIWLRFVDLIAG